MYWTSFHNEINSNATHIPKEHRADWLANRHGELARQEKAIREAEKKSGYTRAVKRFSACDEKLIAAGQDLVAIKPTTIAGVVALITHAIKNHEDLFCEDGDEPAFLTPVVDALKMHARASAVQS
jgi:hypothetical protein